MVSRQKQLNHPVVIVKSNYLDVDPRLEKEIRILVDAGFDISLIGWNRNDASVSPTIDSELFKRSASSSIAVLALMPLWWIFVAAILLRKRPKVIHCINLDSALPSSIIARIIGSRLLYEIHDVYIDMIVPPMRVRNFAIRLEHSMIRLADKVVLANQGHAEELRGIERTDYVMVLNSPPDAAGEVKPNVNHDGPFVVFMAAVLNRPRMIDLGQLRNAFFGVKNAKLVIAGYGNASELVRTLANESNGEIEYVGRISYDEVLRRTLDSDLVLALYNPRVPVIRYSGANKLFEAMMASKPVIVNSGTIMARIVQDEDCGIAVNPRDTNELRRVIEDLRDDPEECRRLGLNGRRAYETKYSWNVMRDRLVQTYSNVLC